MTETSWQRWAARDAELSRRAARLIRRPPLRWLATLIAHSGDSLVWLAVGLGLWRFGGAAAPLGARILVTTLLTGAVSSLLKLLFRRRRPPGESRGFFLRYDRHGFPSGHAARVGGLMVVLGALLPSWGAALLTLWGAGVCVSRVALGLHFAGDIGAGLLVGWLLGLALLGAG